MLIFGTIGVFRTYIPIGSATLAVFRGITGALSILIIMLIIRKKTDISAVKKNLPRLIISGLLIGINWMLLFEAYRFTTVAVATLCYYMAPIFVIIVSPFLLKEKMTVKKAICICLAAFGMVLISGVLNVGEKPSVKGILFGLGAAVIYASVIVINKKITEIDAYSKTIIQLFFAAVSTLPYAIFTEETNFAELSGVSILLIVIVGVLHTGVAYALYFASMDGLPGQTVALYSYIDPLVAVVASVVVLRQNIGIADGIGIVLILAGSIISDINKKHLKG